MSFRSWGFKSNLVFARSVPATQVDATNPVGFNTGGGQCMVYNSGGTDVLISFYTGAAPTLVFPVDAAPPVGKAGTIVPKGARVLVSIPINATSFSAIGQAAGPSIVYVQRGDGSV